MNHFDHRRLIKWFKQQKRLLPWRDQPSPYAVWISEIMLQQTQVNVVIPYFECWMEEFPSVKALAAASLERVLKCWEGLGYYTRARSLHSAANYLVNKYDGQLPKSAAELENIPGIGPYTSGAILSFAFQQKAPALDGNGMRVLTRYFSIHEDLSKPATVKKLWAIAKAVLPEEEPWVFNEALIELGATICKRTPNCNSCPLLGSCRAFSEGSTQDLPIKSAKLKIEHLHRAVAVIKAGDKLLVRKTDPGKIMQDLYEFPYFELSNIKQADSSLSDLIHERFGIKTAFERSLPPVTHTFTRYRAELYPQLHATEQADPIKDYTWLSFDQIQEHPFSAGHRRILASVK